jgi:hypothetical protein
MAVGVKTDHSQSGFYYPIGEDWYYYYETTSDGWRIGEMPDKYQYKSAKLLVVGSNIIKIVYPKYIKPCYTSADFIYNYTDGVDYYYDDQCQIQVYCMKYKSYYYNILTESFYWDDYCEQMVVSNCSKSTYYPGYFFNNIDMKYYKDSECYTTKTIIIKIKNYFVSLVPLNFRGFFNVSIF